MPAKKMVVAKATFRAAGGELIPAGTLVEATDPVVKGREHLFVAPSQMVRTT